LAEESYPEDLKYHTEHDWARIDGEVATFGITWYAQEALGGVVFFDPPDIGTEIKKDMAYADIDSTKASSEVYAPLSGEVTEVNAKVDDEPEAINDDPYGEGWLVKVKLSDPSEVEALMDAAAYKKLLADSAD
jgi:glycine cleavage system H protein